MDEEGKSEVPEQVTVDATRVAERRKMKRSHRGQTWQQMNRWELGEAEEGKGRGVEPLL